MSKSQNLNIKMVQFGLKTVRVDRTYFGNLKINWHLNTLKNPCLCIFLKVSPLSLRMVKEVATGIVLGGRK